MQIQAYITLFTILGMTYLLVRTKVKMDVVFLLGMLVFLSTGVLDEKQIFSSFSSNACIMVIFFYIIIAAMKKNGFLQWMMAKTLGKYTSFNRTLLRLSTATVVLSTFVNNAATGVLIYDPIIDWARGHRISPSRLLLPVAIAIGVGGSLLTIGKSGGMLWADITSSLTGTPVSIFAPFLVGFAVMITTLVCIFLFRNRIREHTDSSKDINLYSEFTLELVVPENSELVGKTLAEAGLFVTEDFFLCQRMASHFCPGETIDSDNQEEVNPATVICGNDRLVFCGNGDAILLLQEKYGLLLPSEIRSLESKSAGSLLSCNNTSSGRYQLGAVMRKSPLIGKKISETDFEADNDVTCISLYREDGFVTTHPRETVLMQGDYITVYGKKLDWDKLSDTLLPKDVPEYVYNYDWRTVFCALVLAAAILTSMFNLMSLVHATFLGVMILGVTHCIGHKEAWSSIGWSTVTVIAGANVVGKAIMTSGLASFLSEGILCVCGVSPIVSLCFLTLASIVFTQFIFDNASIAIMLPVGIATAGQLGCNPMPFALAILMGCSANVCTGISTAYMSMVMIKGHYSNWEMFHYGWPFAIVMFLTIVTTIALCYPLY